MKIYKLIKENIFVVLLSEHSSAQAAQTLFSLFDQSVCPSRIHVGLYELLDNSEPSALEMYKTMAERHSSSGLSFHTQVQVMKRRSKDQGPYGALWEIIEHCLGDEEFVFTCNDACLFSKAWDKECIKESREKTILKQPPSSSFPVFKDFKENLPELSLEVFHVQDSVPILFFQRNCSFAPNKFWASIKNYRN
jgi:hypothetical protein